MDKEFEIIESNIEPLNEEYIKQPPKNYEGFVIDGEYKLAEKRSVVSTVEELKKRLDGSAIPGEIIWCTKKVLKEYYGKS